MCWTRLNRWRRAVEAARMRAFFQARRKDSRPTAPLDHIPFVVRIAPASGINHGWGYFWVEVYLHC